DRKLVDKKVKVIICDNGTEFKKSVMDDFCAMKGIRKELSVASTPQKNGVAERRNMTLIEAARTMALVVKSHNKTPYELFRGKTHALSFMRPFGCHVTIFNTLDHLGKFDRKADEGYFVRYSINSKASRVYNIRTRRVEENLHIEFLENKIIVAGAGPEWLFDIDMLTKSINYVPVITGTNFDDFAGTKDSIGASQSKMKTRSTQDYIFMLLWKDGSPIFDSSLKISGDAGKKHDEVSDKEKTIATYDDSEDDDDFTNLESSIHVSPTPTTRTHMNHPLKQVIGRKTHEDLNTCLFACFLSQIESTRVAKALSDFAWVETIHEELLQFKLQKVWILVDLPKGKKAIDTKWVFRNKKDKRGIMIKNKARLVAQGDTQEEGIDYDEVFYPVARIKAIRLFLAYASFMRFMVYVDDIIFGSTKKELCTEFERLMKDKFQMSSIGELTFFLGLQVKQKEDGIFISHDKYVIEVLRKFNFLDVKYANTPMDTENTLVKDADGDDVDVHLYRSMIGSLMYLTAFKPDIMYAVCVCARFQVTPKVVYTNSDYAEASLDRKSTTGGCQFLGSRLISWQCKKQTVVATSTTEAKYMAAASCCRQVKQSSMVVFGEMIQYNLTTGLAKTTAWNEFSSTMASAIICLATNKKFNFSKYIFDHMVKNLEGGVKFLMFLRFVQVFLDSQVEGMRKHKEIYVTPSHTKKIFANMKGLGKDFSEIPIDSHHTPTVNQPSTSSPPQNKQKSKKSKKKITKVPQLSDSTNNVADEHVTTTSNHPLLS
nr:hypothetical protein [Tanacetum cinerariifolium]